MQIELTANLLKPLKRYIYPFQTKNAWVNIDLQRHRRNGPAIVHCLGTKVHFLYDLCHNIKGPAEICKTGWNTFYLGGIIVAREMWQIKKDEFKEGAIKWGGPAFPPFDKNVKYINSLD